MKVQPLAAQLALLLVRPGSGYRRQLAVAGRAFESVGGEGARQFGEFVRRVSDLSLDEFKELYDETFPHGCPLDVAALAHPAPTPSLPSETREALDVAILMLERLEHARNPFAWLVRALCCLLLNDAGRPQSR
jgi:nitrate reductase assembly molybdenum cofactor insertion protein NarJ